MELRHLATFVAVAEEGSFTRASDRLRVVQSAVSAAVRNLERELGAPLFDRTTHKVTLTDAGRALLPEARKALAAADAARDAVDQVRGGLRGTVNLGIMQVDALGTVNIAALLSAFRSQHPDVELHATQANSTEMAIRVRDGRLDFAFLALSSAHAPGLQLTAIASEPMPLAVHEDHPLAGCSELDITALIGEKFADGPVTFGARAAVDKAFAAAGLQRDVVLEVNDTGTLADFVRHGLAVAFLAPSFVRDMRGIVMIPIRRNGPVFESYIAEPNNRRLGAAAVAMLELAKHHITST
jgi:DNA-binding transcriptional LysR family regulator